MAFEKVNGKFSGVDPRLGMKAAKAEEAPKAEVKEVPAEAERKEIGEKLLEAPYAGFAKETPVAVEDRAQLQELFALAGIKARVPSKEVYERIGAGVVAASRNLDKLETANRAEELFKSEAFRKFENLFE